MQQRCPQTQRVTPGVPTAVSVDNDASSKYTVVEVATRDRVGVLYAITRVFADLGLDIHLAKVDTEGEKVADVFYVTLGQEAEKVMDGDLLAELERELYAALDAVEGE